MPCYPACDEFRLQSQIALGIKSSFSNTWQCDLKQVALTSMAVSAEECGQE